MKSISLIYLVLIVHCSLSTMTFGQLTSSRDGKLDRSFGTNGLIGTDPATKTGQYMGGGDFAQLPDGKILAMYPLISQGGVWSFVLARYLDNGSPDGTFGTNGRMVLSNWNNFFPKRVVVQKDGKLIVGGMYVPGEDFMLVRLTADGQPDAGFGNNGVVIKDFAVLGETSFDDLSEIILQPDGKIIAAGISERNITNDATDILVSMVRFNSNGSIDQSFGKNGVTVHVGNRGTAQWPSYLASRLLENGKILVATSRPRSFPQTPNEYHLFTNLLRFRHDGTLDPEFSDDGIVDFEAGSLVRGLYVYSNGKILISDSLNLRRFNANGSPDTTFYFNPIYNGFIQLICLAVIDDGKILVGGVKQVSNGSVTQSFGAVRRFWADGTPDINFGFHGESLFRAENLDTIATGFAYAPNQKLLIMGQSGSFPELKFVIARYYITRKP